jgi:hypothetical protein
VGDNPPKGAIIDYFLKAKPQPDQEITLEILDAQGAVLRKFSNHKKEKFEQPVEWPDREAPAELLPDAAGMNRFAWDLRVEDAVQIPGAFYADEGPRGPVVNPGSYTVRMTTPYGVQSVSLEVVLDPRLADTVTAADVAAHWDLARKINEDIEALHRAVNQIRGSRAEIARLHEVSSGFGSTTYVAASAGFERKMVAIEEQLIQVNMKASEDNLRYPNRLNEQYDTFSATVDGDDVRPTQSQQQVFTELHQRLGDQLAKWKSLTDADLPALNDQLQHAGMERIAVPAGE